MEDRSEGQFRASRQVQILNPEGMHLRAVTLLIQVARRFQSSVWVSNHDLRVDAKTSPLQLLVLCGQPGDLLTIEAIGPDAAEAVEAIARLISQGFEQVPPEG